MFTLLGVSGIIKFIEITSLFSDLNASTAEKKKKKIVCNAIKYTLKLYGFQEWKVQSILFNSNLSIFYEM